VNSDSATTGQPSPRSAATLRDVALAAGVSTASVSRALDPNSPYVSTELRARVKAAADRLGYRPNASARATTTGATSIVAVLVSDIRDPYNAEIVNGVIEHAGRSGLLATFTGTDYATDDETRAVRMMRSIRPHSMILTGARTGTATARDSLVEELARYTREGGRVVVAGDDELDFDTAVVPRRRGAAALVTALAGMGYRSPAVILPEHDSAAAREWESGVITTARSLGMRLDYDAVLRAPLNRDGGYEAAARLLAQRPEGTDVVLAANDAVAIGAMTALRESGIEPGADIGVAGFDNVAGVEDVSPSLTSVDLALGAVGAKAVELSMLEATADRRIAAFEPRVVQRESTPPRQR
jgi:LacI family transcriptional regulator